MITLKNHYHLDVEEAAKGNVLIVGQTSSGKSRLAMAIADILMKEGWQIIAFDPTGIWKRESSIPQVQTLYEGTPEVIVNHGSTILDMSNLYLNTQGDLVNRVAKYLWESRVNGSHHKTLLVFEEAQLYTRNIKSFVAQELFRISMSGRNIGIRLCLISPRLNNVSTEFIFLSTQKFLGLSNEENVQKKIRSMYGKSVSEMCKNLRIGQFIYADRQSKTKKIQVPLFTSPRKPKEFIEIPQSPQPQIQPKRLDKITALFYMMVTAAITFLSLKTFF